MEMDSTFEGNVEEFEKAFKNERDAIIENNGWKHETFSSQYHWFWYYSNVSKKWYISTLPDFSSVMEMRTEPKFHKGYIIYYDDKKNKTFMSFNNVDIKRKTCWYNGKIEIISGTYKGMKIKDFGPDILYYKDNDTNRYMICADGKYTFKKCINTVTRECLTIEKITNFTINSSEGYLLITSNGYHYVSKTTTPHKVHRIPNRKVYTFKDIDDYYNLHGPVGIFYVEEEDMSEDEIAKSSVSNISSLIEQCSGTEDDDEYYSDCGYIKLIEDDVKSTHSKKSVHSVHSVDSATLEDYRERCRKSNK